MAVARYLVDTSALARLKNDAVATVLLPLVGRGLTGVCGTIALELLFSSRTADDHARIREALETREWLHTDDEDFHRAVEVHTALATDGRQRAVPPSDLVIAAVAERHQVTVLHYDSDFDLIAEITEQPTEWVVPRGSLN